MTEQNITDKPASSSNGVLSDELNRLREGVTKRGSKKCAEWLAYCLETGWKKDQLDELEKIYWKWRDKNGELKAV